MSQFYALAPASFNSAARSCDCIAHVYGNAADHPDRVRRYPSDMTDAEWAAVRPLLPVPAWLEGKGGQPEGYCHRQMLDAIRYLVAGGISYRAVCCARTWRSMYGSTASRTRRRSSSGSSASTSHCTGCSMSKP